MKPASLLIFAAFFISIANTANAQSKIEVFSPIGEAKQVSQVKVRFSTAMTSMGDVRQSDPFIVDCSASGDGLWIDPKNWVYRFGKTLDSGNSCTFQPIPGLRDIQGNKVQTKPVYKFTTGGPTVRYTRPYDGNRNIAEDQYFQIFLDGKVDKASVEKLAWCSIDNLAEKIPVIVLDTPKDKSPSDNAIWLRCQNTLPPATKLRLVWEKGIQSPNSVATSSRQFFSYVTRAPFRADFSCARSSSQEPCSPLSDFVLRFSAPVLVRDAKLIKLIASDGSVIAPDFDDMSDEEAERQGTRTVRFKGPFAERQNFSIILPDNLDDDAGRILQNASSFPLKISTGEFPPLIKFSGTFGILEHKTGAVLPVSIRGVESSLPNQTISIGRSGKLVKTKDPFEILRWMERVNRAEWGRTQQEDGKWVYNNDDPHPSVFSQNQQTQSFEMPETADDKALEVIGIPLKEPGFYVVELKSRVLGSALSQSKAPYHVATSALVTNMAVHFKWGQDSSAIWVTYLDSGLPVRGAHVQIGNECSGKIIWQGQTQKNGLAIIENQIPASASWTSCNSDRTPPLIITASTSADFSFTRTSWNDGISPWEFGVQTGYSGDRIKAHTVLDRSLFRAGETVSMKHFLRQTSATGLELVSGAPKKAKLILSHIRSGQSFELPLVFDKWGRAANQWKIPDDARLGEYRLAIKYQNDTRAISGQFRVEEFKIPLMQAFLSGPGTPVINGRNIEMKALVRYLSGGGASGQNIRLISKTTPDWKQFPNWPDYSFKYQNIKEGTFKRGERPDTRPIPFQDDQSITLDANGSATINIAGLPGFGQRMVLRSELEYKDANGETLVQNKSTSLWPASIALGIKTEGWAASENELKFSVLAIGTDQKPVANQQVDVSLYLEKNLSWRKRMIGGYYSYENEQQISLLEPNCTGKTNRNGLLFCKLKLGVSGEILLQAKTKDSQGNTATSTRSVWLAGEDDWWFDQQQGDRMDLLVERAELEDGDTAKIQVRSPFRNATALVTIEREGIIDSFVTNISGKKPVIRVPIKGRYSPNVYVSVLAVRGRVGGFRSWLADKAREYDLPWLSRDGGAPTGLIDLSKPAFRLGMTKLTVGQKAFRLNVDVSTDQQTYAIRGTARVKVKVTSADGSKLPDNSEISLAVVDAGLLQLYPNKSWNILSAFMEPRGLQVFTSTAQMQVVGKRHYGRKAVHPGGGGEDEAVSSMMRMSPGTPARAKPREAFNTLLLWQGSVELDKNGEAYIDVPINDSLTEFVIAAIANGGSDKFGTGKSKFTVTQDVQLISALPPVVRENDLFTAVFTLRNTTAREQTLRVEAVNSIGRPLKPQTITIGAAEAREVKWEILVPFDQKHIEWQIQAFLPGREDPADNMIISQKIIPAIPVTVMQSTVSSLKSPQSWPVSRALDAIPGRGGLQIALRNKLGGKFKGVESYMRNYPYTCYEQRTSVAISLNDKQLWQELMDATPAFLDDDGLLKFFVSDNLRGSDVLTSYVLKIADEAGWKIDPTSARAMQNGLMAFVEGRLSRSMPMGDNELIYRKLSAINALGRYGMAKAETLTSLEFSAQLLPTSALLDWIGILERVEGIPNRSSQLEQARQQLRVRLDLQGTRLNFSTNNNDRLWWLMETVDANAARTLITTQTLENWQEDAPRLSLGLMSRQQYGRWETTTANAWGVVAMRKFSERFEKTPVTGTTKIIYGKQNKIIEWEPSEDRTAELPWDQDAKTIKLAHEGSGAPWAFVTANAATPLTEPLFAGIQIKRTVEAVEQKQAGKWHVGDVMRIRLEVKTNSDMSWVVVDDPVPSGASILGKGLQTSSARLSQTRNEGSAWPVFTERKFDSYRSYYRFVPGGTFALEYTVRLNTSGRFQLPPSRVEAMYAPEIFGAMPISELVIEP